MDQFEEIFSYLEAHALIAYPAIGAVVVLSILWALWGQLMAPTWSPEEFWALKKKAIKVFEEHYKGLSLAETAKRFSLPQRHMKLALDELVRDGFLVEEGEEGDVIVYRLKRLLDARGR